MDDGREEEDAEDSKGFEAGRDAAAAEALIIGSRAFAKCRNNCVVLHPSATVASELAPRSERTTLFAARLSALPVTSRHRADSALVIALMTGRGTCAPPADSMKTRIRGVGPCFTAPSAP